MLNIPWYSSELTRMPFLYRIFRFCSNNDSGIISQGKWNQSGTVSGFSD